MKDMPTKERLLYAALELISEKGYDGVGVDLIAERAGIKGPSLYRHYKGKDDIFNSLIDMVEARYVKGFVLNNEKGNSPESMEELIENAMEKIRFTMNDDIICKTRKILAMEQFRSKRIAELTSHYHFDNLQEMYTDIFSAMMEKGLLKQGDSSLLALEFVSPVSLLIHVYDRQPERDAEVIRMIRRHFEHFAEVYGEKSSC